MTRRESLNDICDRGDLSRLAERVVDQRQVQRPTARNSCRDRHCEKKLIRDTLTLLSREDAAFDHSADPA